MNKIFYLISLILFFVSCDTKEEHTLSPELEEVRMLMQTNPETALLELQDLKPSGFQNLSDSVTQRFSYLEYTILLAEAFYKNYLPQDNFNDIKAIVDFLEEEKTIPNSTLLIPNYLCAKAYYYHAVGLSERDDIAGTCEYYLKTLDILSKIEKPNYEQTRFIFLTYTRIGELFLNENFCDIAITKFKHALKYAKLLDNKNSISSTLKLIGSTYNLAGDVDSAFFYLNKSLNICSNVINRLDVEKILAQILYRKGEKDSAYSILRNNLDKIENYGAKHSYYTLLGEFYYLDNKYDSAIYYMEQGLESQFFYTKLNASMRLSSIYDSLKDYDKKAYYDNIISQLSVEKIEKGSDNAKLQNLYDEYNKRKRDKETSIVRRNTYFIICSLVVLALAIAILIRYRYRNSQKKLMDTLDSKEKMISEFKDKLKIRDKKLSEIRKKEKRIDLESYYHSEICQTVLHKKPSDFTPLTDIELSLLLEAATHCNIIKVLNDRYPSLNMYDLYCICLILLNIEKNRFQYLLGRSRKTIWERFNRIRSIMEIQNDEDLYIFISTKLM